MGRHDWAELAEEIGAHVLAHLSWSENESGRFRGVCSRWREVHDALVPCIQPASPTLPRRPGSFEGVRCLQLRRWKVYERYIECDWKGPDLARRFPKLTAIDACSCHALITDKFLETLAPALPQLTALNLSYVSLEVTNAGGKALGQLPNLRALDLGPARGLKDKGVKGLAEATTLTHLNLSHCRAVTDAGMLAVAAALSALTSLTLESVDKVTDEGVRALAGLAELTVLNLDGLDAVTDYGVKALSGLTKLHSLNLGCVEVSDEGVMALGHLTGLDFLKLSYSERVTDESLRAIAQLPVLEQLELRELLQVTDQGLVALAQGSQSIKSLTLEGLGLVTDQGIDSLRDLKLACLPAFTIGGMKELSCAQSLRHICLEDMELTDAGLTDTISKLDVLQSVRIAHCDGISDNGLKSLALLPSLKALQVQYCGGVTASVKEMDLFPHLEAAHLSIIPGDDEDTLVPFLGGDDSQSSWDSDEASNAMWEPDIPVFNGQPLFLSEEDSEDPDTLDEEEEEEDKEDEDESE